MAKKNKGKLIHQVLDIGILIILIWLLVVVFGVDFSDSISFENQPRYAQEHGARDKNKVLLGQQQVAHSGLYTGLLVMTSPQDQSFTLCGNGKNVTLGADDDLADRLFDGYYAATGSYESGTPLYLEVQGDLVWVHHQFGNRYYDGKIYVRNIQPTDTIRHSCPV